MLSDIDDLKATFKGTTVFPNIGLFKAYKQVLMAADGSRKVTITYPFKL